MKIALLSDTHAYLDDRIERHLTDCDEIWHAGDIGSLSVANRLMAYAPLRAVHGNIDDHIIRYQYPEFTEFTLENVRVLMTHIGGYPGHYSPQLSRRFLQSDFLRAPEPVKILVSGHSHILRVIYDKGFNMLTLNPGAAGLNGFHKVRTLLKFNLLDGKISDMDVINIPRTFPQEK